ncbi:heparinase II/III family protein [Pseudonocardia thermophila]|uniref:heparinase II/III family protein n=1 Tax=Pseudonocardia thermophila TaxID=1848 RepID=UPI00248E7A6A|nr:alginate lyase family protein [Pseudonocardia thermophila]
MGPGWYLRRLSRMGPAEIAGRVVTAARVRRFRRRLGAAPATASWLAERVFAAPLPDGALARVTAEAQAALIETADRLMDGRAEFFGVERTDMAAPDWFLDPKTGRHAPADAYAFDVPHRDEELIGDVKQLWEPSRHQHLTVLAAAYALTGDERYAHRVADHLKSWWAANPPLRGVHWLSGIELGIRLISWVWVRRLLAGWPQAPELFEHNPVALHQLHEHQRWLVVFPSRGSSANNHVIAELAGLVVATSAVPWFAESAAWRERALRALDRHLVANTFPSGLNRELATEYHGLVLELGLAAAVEAARAGHPVPDTTWDALVRMCDALAAIVDVRLRPPRQGDADDGRGLVLDGTATDRWASLLATGDALFGRRDWWPVYPAGDVLSTALAALAAPTGRRAALDPRPTTRPHELPDAGLTILRTAAGEGPELWCRCDGGPHGFLSIAAHAHADALSVEVRHDGVDVLADPGTYCYHGEPTWRRYFRSTIGHNTLEVDGRDQSRSGGPFLWIRHARTRVRASAPRAWWAEHTGYGRAGVHRRSVRLDGRGLDIGLVITDELDGPAGHACRLAFHLGPDVSVALTDSTARLRWPGGAGELRLPKRLSWTVHRGETHPPLGWYSPGFGRKVVSTTLVGTGVTDPAGLVVRTHLTVRATSEPVP